MTPLDRRDAEEALRRSGVADLAEAPARVRDVVPPRYPAYARLLPPLGVVPLGTTDLTPRRWRDVVGAERAPGALPRLLREATARLRGEGFDVLPYVGELDPATWRALVPLLAAATPGGEAYFHFGRPGADPLGEPLYRGPVAAVTEFVPAVPAEVATPATVWAAGGEWCVGCWTDSYAAHVGGSAALVAAILAHPDIEADPVSPDDPVDDALT